MNQRRWELALDSLLCLLAGALQALCAGWPSSARSDTQAAIELAGLAEWAWLLQLLASGIFFGVLSRLVQRTAGRTVWAAAVWGFSWQAGVIWWLHIGMHKYAGLPAALSVAAVAALAAYLTIYTVLCSLLFWWSARALRRWGCSSGLQPLLHTLALAGAFAGACLLAELGRAMVLTGFPWATSGYAHLLGPLRPLAPWVGVYGAGVVAAFVAALMVGLLAQLAQAAQVAQTAQAAAGVRAPRRAALARALTAAALAAGVAAGLAALAKQPDALFTTSSGEFEVVLLQGNVSQEGKFEEARIAQSLGWHLREMARSFADLTLTAETAFVALEQDLPAIYWQRLQQRVQAQPGALLIGLPHRVGPQGQSNVLLGMGHPQTLLDAPDGGVYRYHKAHLVPFAEFTPPGFAWFTKRLDLPLPTFVAGAADAPPLRIRTRAGTVQTVAPLICFEDLYGEELALRFRQPERAPTVLANASNMAWFDNSSALPQHLRIAQYRSLELQRPTVRATNTGPTVVINHLGQVTRALPPHTQGVLSAVVEGRTGLTPYAWWVSRTGLWPLVALAAGLLLLPCGLVVRRRGP